MAAKYSGPDRRHEQEDGRQGRRKSDWHCPDHDYIQEATKESRDRVCGKIKVLSDEVGKMVPWKVFAFLFTFAVLVGGAGFGFFSVHIDKLGDKHDRAMEVIQKSLSDIASNQAVMAEQMASIKKRQDVLRDAHLKKMLEDKANESNEKGD
jgi:hypothetical protein